MGCQGVVRRLDRLLGILFVRFGLLRLNVRGSRVGVPSSNQAWAPSLTEKEYNAKRTRV
jgi:hypothetical protein